MKPLVDSRVCNTEIIGRGRNVKAVLPIKAAKKAAQKKFAGFKTANYFIYQLGNYLLIIGRTSRALVMLTTPAQRRFCSKSGHVHFTASYIIFGITGHSTVG